MIHMNTHKNAWHKRIKEQTKNKYVTISMVTDPYSLQDNLLRKLYFITSSADL